MKINPIDSFLKTGLLEVPDLFDKKKKWQKQKEKKEIQRKDKRKK